MLPRQAFRQASRAAHAYPQAAVRTRAAYVPAFRAFSSTPRQHEDEPHKGEVGDHVGSFSRTESIVVEHPNEKDYPKSQPVQGRGGYHFKRTLATFSLEGNVGLVTGGARGLGLVMSQALVISGANVAIVDLNSA